MRTRKQEYAERAFDTVNRRRPGDYRDSKEYLAFARSFPTLLHTSGLAQACAFASARGGHHEDVLKDTVAVVGNFETKAFLERCRTSEVPEYMALYRKTLMAASWVKRYAEALLKPAVQDIQNRETPGATAHASHTR